MIEFLQRTLPFIFGPLKPEINRVTIKVAYKQVIYDDDDFIVFRHFPKHYFAIRFTFHEPGTYEVKFSRIPFTLTRGAKHMPKDFTVHLNHPEVRIIEERDLPDLLRVTCTHNGRSESHDLETFPWSWCWRQSKSA